MLEDRPIGHVQNVKRLAFQNKKGVFKVAFGPNSVEPQVEASLWDMNPTVEVKGSDSHAQGRSYLSQQLQSGNSEVGDIALHVDRRGCIMI